MKTRSNLVPALWLCLFAGAVWGQEPRVAWLQQAGGPGAAVVMNMAIDGDDNLYITGGVGPGWVDFGDKRILTGDSTEFLLAKADPQGHWLWAVHAPGTYTGWAKSVTVDTDGSVYVAGHFNGSMSWGDFTLSSTGGYDVFVVKANSAGQIQWAVRDGPDWPVGPTDRNYGTALAPHPNGGVLLAGVFEDQISLGGKSATVVDYSGMALFLTRLNPNGNAFWMSKAEGSVDWFAMGLATEQSGNAFVAGGFWNLLRLGDVELRRLENTEGPDIFVTKVDTNGTFVWAKQVKCPHAGRAFSVAADHAGNAFVTGTFYNSVTIDQVSLNTLGTNRDGLVIKFDPSGNLTWAKQIGGQGTVNGVAIRTDLGGNAYVAGLFDGQATFDQITLTSDGDADMFLAKMSPGGDFVWAKKGGGTKSDIALGVEVDSRSDIFVAGHFESSLFVLESLSLTNHVVPDPRPNTSPKSVFLAKFASTPVRPALSQVRLMLDGRFEFTVTVPDSRTYQIETSSDLSDWTVLTNVTANQSSISFRDDSAAAHDHRFYRAVSP
jgi:hypothetical protein